MLYLDYNSTHPPFLDLIHQAVEAVGENYANPSGISFPSQRNQARLEQARSALADTVHRMHGFSGSADGVLFVSTGTEAIYHMVAAFAPPEGGRALVSPYEHSCMYAACQHFGLDLAILDADRSGCVDPARVQERLSGEDFAFVAVTAACNETGVIQPLTQIREAIGLAGTNLPLLSDSIQVTGKSYVDLSAADAVALNGHKLGAGTGAAALLLRDPSRFRPIFRGGLQEKERRAGTENLLAILALSEALKRQEAHQAADGEASSRNRTFHGRIEVMLRERCGAIIAGEQSPRTSTTFAVFPSMGNMDFLLMALDREKILCSTGSSCKSRARQPSTILRRMGFSHDESLQALRFSTGMFTTVDEVDRFCDIFPDLFRKCNA